MARKRRVSEVTQSTQAAPPSHAPTSKRCKTPPPDLSGASVESRTLRTQIEKLTAYFEECDRNGKPPFNVQYGRAAGAKGKAKSKQSGSGDIRVQFGLQGVKYLEDTYVTIQPAAKWAQLKRYSRFAVGTETIGNGEIILVDHGETGQDTDIGAKIKARGNIKKNVIDVAHQWKAQVHDTRALNENRVFILVSWLNRPSDLPTGPAPYHAKNELIPTNEVCIIDAMTVNGPLNVVHWDEYDDTAAPPEEDQYFWRQTYNYITKSLSVPDEAARRAAAATSMTQLGQTSSNGSGATEGDSMEAGAGKPDLEGAIAVSKVAGVEAYVFIKATKSSTEKREWLKNEELKMGSVNQSQVVIIDKRGKDERRRSERVRCLSCRTVIGDHG
ncbi:hypothetical protein H2203_005257 [Taxawa tesnikishii (nom. ined.)]|nr:hypothetical protein H2203_005257 [Dothideales sp. JES 119]